MELILIRHGTTEYNEKKAFHGWTDSELCPEGLRQAEQTANKLRFENVDAIYTSPLKRTVLTSQIMSRLWGTSIVEDERLKEVNFGLFEGLTYSEIEEKYVLESKQWMQEGLLFCFPEGESIYTLFRRLSSFLDMLSQKSHEKVAIVTHEGCIRCILSYVICGSPEYFWKFTALPGSISRIKLDREYPYIISVNQEL